MKVYHIVDQYGRNLDFYDNKFYENCKPTYTKDKRLAEITASYKKNCGITSNIVTTIIDDKDLKSIDLF